CVAMAPIDPSELFGKSEILIAPFESRSSAWSMRARKIVTFCCEPVCVPQRAVNGVTANARIGAAAATDIPPQINVRRVTLRNVVPMESPCSSCRAALVRRPGRTLHLANGVNIVNRLHMRPLGYALGAELTGVNLREPVDEATLAEIKRV